MDRMKTSPEDCDLLLVGGGSIIAPQTLKGVSNVMYVCFTLYLALLPHYWSYIFSSLPKHHEVANAVGAAIASVSGEVDTIEILEGRSLPDVLENIKQRAVDRAVKSGAQPGSVRIVDVNVLPVQVCDFPSGCVKQTSSKLRSILQIRRLGLSSVLLESSRKSHRWSHSMILLRMR